MLLGTKDVLTRPWCLLELDDAARHGVPVVVMTVNGSGYDAQAAEYLIEHLQTELERRNPGTCSPDRLTCDVPCDSRCTAHGCLSGPRSPCLRLF